MSDWKCMNELIHIFLDNAVKYCDKGGTISVSAAGTKKNVTVSVTNDYKEGEGVDYSRFFERFYRNDESHNSEKAGYGIGLSIAGELSSCCRLPFPYRTRMENHLLHNDEGWLRHIIKSRRHMLGIFIMQLVLFQESAFEVLHAGFEERLRFVAGDVLGNVGAASFCMAHLAQDSSIRLVMPSTAQEEPFGLKLLS